MWAGDVAPLATSREPEVTPLAAALMVMLLALVLAIVTQPLNAIRRKRRGAYAAELAELEAERDLKYQEIRDAELDHEMGKHSDEDFAAVDGALKEEALKILDRIEAVQALESASTESHSETH